MVLTLPRAVTSAAGAYLGGVALYLLLWAVESAAAKVADPGIDLAPAYPGRTPSTGEHVKAPRTRAS